MDKITFKQILNQENFNKLKREFLLKDFYYDSIRFTEQSETIEIDLSKNDICIYFSTNVVDDFEIDMYGKCYNEKPTYIYEEYPLNFINDYLYPKIKNQIKYLKKVFENEIKSKAIYETTALQRFCNIKLAQLNKLIDLIKDSPHLDSAFQDKIISDLESFYQFINCKYLEKSEDVNSKIPFKLNKNQVILLFELMHRKNIISGIHVNDLHKQIEICFTYHNGTKNIEIKKSKKAADELIGAKSSKSAQPTLDSLEKIFLAKDFFVV